MRCASPAGHEQQPERAAPRRLRRQVLATERDDQDREQHAREQQADDAGFERAGPRLVATLGFAARGRQQRDRAPYRGPREPERGGAELGHDEHQRADGERRRPRDHAPRQHRRHEHEQWRQEQQQRVVGREARPCVDEVHGSS
jgi:hypothetical protein